jgi:LemA protein
LLLFRWTCSEEARHDTEWKDPRPLVGAGRDRNSCAGGDRDVGVIAHNDLLREDRQVRAQWTRVESACLHRYTLVPALVEEAKGVAAFERETFVDVAQARARVGQLSSVAPRELMESPEAFARAQQTQDRLSFAVSRLLVVIESYPMLQATQRVRALQTELEAAEDRIAAERMRFNEAARAFNARRNRFPTVLLVRLFGHQLDEKPYFQVPSYIDAAAPVAAL